MRDYGFQCGEKRTVWINLYYIMLLSKFSVWLQHYLNFNPIIFYNVLQNYYIAMHVIIVAVIFLVLP